MQKVKFKWNGKLGSTDLYFNEKTGNYTDIFIPVGPSGSSSASQETLEDTEFKF